MLPIRFLVTQVLPAEQNGAAGSSGGGRGGATVALRVVLRRGNKDDRSRELHVRLAVSWKDLLQGFVHTDHGG